MGRYRKEEKIVTIDKKLIERYERARVIFNINHELECELNTFIDFGVYPPIMNFYFNNFKNKEQQIIYVPLHELRNFYTKRIVNEYEFIYEEIVKIRNWK